MNQNIATLIPYTDIVGNTTYRNIYCAMCNDDLIPIVRSGVEDEENSKFHSKFQDSPPSMWDLRVLKGGKSTSKNVV